MRIGGRMDGGEEGYLDFWYGKKGKGNTKEGG